MDMHGDLEESVMKTVLWFSQFSYPLTTFEIWKWLLAPARGHDLSEVYAVLEQSQWLARKLERQDGFYALTGSGIQSWIRRRQEQFLDAERKFLLLRRAARWFSLLPAVECIAAANTLAWWSTSAKSDIDLYIVTKPNHIWSSRFWLVLPFLLMGRRPSRVRRTSIPHPFCFSFFSTTKQLNLAGLCLSRDYYMGFWVRSLVPIVDRHGTFAKFQRENFWAMRVVPNAHPRQPHHYQSRSGSIHLPIQWRFLEPVWRALQMKRLPASLCKMANIDSRVMISNDILKFHENDRRAQYRDTFESMVAQHL